MSLHTDPQSAQSHVPTGVLGTRTPASINWYRNSACGRRKSYASNRGGCSSHRVRSRLSGSSTIDVPPLKILLDDFNSFATLASHVAGIWETNCDRLTAGFPIRFGQKLKMDGHRDDVPVTEASHVTLQGLLNRTVDRFTGICAVDGNILFSAVGLMRHPHPSNLCSHTVLWIR